MKLVIFAHTPPPHHGQSYMVHLMLEGFGGDHRKKRAKSPASSSKHNIICYHVNARVSHDLEDIGQFQLKKLFLLLGHCFSAIWCRFRYGVKTLYYIPAPGKRSALIRDWIVMFFCRPFFPKIILHWHAAGLAKWLETSMQIRSRELTYKYLKQVDLSVVLSQHNRGDAEKLLPKQIAVVPNGIPDPCPDFEENLLPRRRARFAMRKKLLTGEALTADEKTSGGDDAHLFKILFVGHCTRAKGLFDTLDAVALANQNLEKCNSPIRVVLSIAGEFTKPEDWAEFQKRIGQSDLLIQLPNKSSRETCISYKNFVQGAAKIQLFTESDCFCFPTYHYAESFGLVLAEAMAFGMQIVASRWRSIPEVMPKNFSGLVEPQRPDQIAAALLAAATSDFQTPLRQYFLDHFTINKHFANLEKAIRSIE